MPAPGYGELAHEERGHGGDKEEAGHAHFLGQREEALLCRTVKPLQEPAFGREHEESQEGLHEKGVGIVEEFPEIGFFLLPGEAHGNGARGKPLAAAVAHGDKPEPDGRAREHAVLLQKERADIEKAEEEEAAQGDDGYEGNHGTHHLGTHRGAYGVVHGSEHAPPPCEKSPEGGQRGEPQRHVGHEKAAA